MRPSHAVPLLGLCLPLIGGLSAMAQEPIVHEGVNTDPNPGPPGEPPYEMAGRAEPHAPIADFQDVSGWVVEGYDAEGWLYRSEDRKLYDRPYCGKLTYVGLGPSPRLVVRPKEPIEIPDPWDAVDFWNWGNFWGWAPDPSTPALGVEVLLRDADGNDFGIHVGYMDYQYWFLMNGRLGERAPARPVSFVGLSFTGGRNTEPRSIYLGPCAFYEESRAPLTFEPWPETLPFPTRAETILPTNLTEQFANSAVLEGDTAVFRYEGEDCDLEYRYAPVTGTLGDIELRYADRILHPCAGGGVHLLTPDGALAPDDPRVARVLLDSSLEGDTLTARWRLSAGEVSTVVTHRLRIRQKSLIVEAEADSPVVERLSLGRAEGVTDAKLFRFPYLTYGGNDPRVLLAEDLFLFEQFDWYCSDASDLYGGAQVGDGFAVYNGGALYNPKSDGARNPVRERLFLTASPDVTEVLPTIPNPASPMRDRMADRLWRVKDGFNRDAEVEQASQYRAYGCEKVAIRYHEDSWRDAGESFTFRLTAGPARGGDPPLRDMVERVQALGWLVGLYTNYTDFAPVNSHWDPDHVSRHPNGDLQRAWMRCYAPKPMWSVEMEAELAPQIRERFGSNHSYCDVHTAVTPFERVDYDARVPGAGTFRRTFECFGRLLFNEKTAYRGPVYSEGRNHWWYAGLTDGNYAQIISPSPPEEPLLPAFDLLKMHPLEMDAGMGAPGMFFGAKPWNLDQFLATTLAYGHIGFLEWPDMDGALKLYYMLQPLQKHYVMVPVERIEYEHDGRMLYTSDALRTGAYLAGRLHVAYESGFEVWVNGGADVWDVAGPGETTYPLPQWGFLALAPDGSVAAASHGSAPEPGADAPGVACSFGEGQRYISSPTGYGVAEEKLACSGSAALKREKGEWWIIPTTGFSEFAFAPELVGASADAAFEVTGVASDGSEIGPAEARIADTGEGRALVHVWPTNPPAARYRVTETGERAPGRAHATDACVPGEPKSIEMTGVSPVGLVARWVWDGGEEQCEYSLRDGPGEPTVLSCRVPKTVAPGERLWLNLRGADGVLWAGFTALPAVEVSLRLEPGAEAAEGETVPATLHVRSHLEREAAFHMRLVGSEGVSVRVGDAPATIGVHGSTDVPIELALPHETGEREIAIDCALGGHAWASTVKLTTALERRTLLDLCDARLPYARGLRRRTDAAETVGGAALEDGDFGVGTAVSGGVGRPAVFIHPPYKRGAGYSFASVAVDLPPEPAVLTVHLGMRDGLNATDGVTFAVAVIDDAGVETELFREHYARTAWEPREVSLAPYAGRGVTLKLICDCGPSDDTTADHALWGDARIRSEEMALRVSLDE